MKVTDGALGYVPPPDTSNPNPAEPIAIQRLQRREIGDTAQDMQERWLDYPELYDEWERQRWEAEGDEVARQATIESEERAKREAREKKGKTGEGQARPRESSTDM